MKRRAAELSAPEPLDVTNLADLLRARATEFADKQAFCFIRSDGEEERSLTYRALHERAMAIGREVGRTASAGDRALLLFPPGLDFISALFGCLYAGVVAVPVAAPGRDRSTSSVEAVISACDPSLVLTTSAYLERTRRSLAHRPALLERPWIPADAVTDQEPLGWQPPRIEGAQTALLQYTSGSTSSPKGVVLSHRELLYNASLIRHAFGNSTETRGVFWLPLYHDMGLIGGVIQPVYCGGSCTLMAPAAFLQRPALWLQTISRTRASVSGGPDFAYDLCTRKISVEECRGLDLSRWEVAFSGSERIRARTLERFASAFAPYGFRREALFPCYGLAEATLLVSGGPRGTAPVVFDADADALSRNQVAPGPPEGPGGVSLVGCGQGLPGQRIAIVDPETAQPCEEGRIGEIWVQGPSVARGYHERPEATAAVFDGRLAGTSEGPFLRTGDLGFVRQGQLFVTGRLKDLIIIRGRNYFPEDLEHSIDGAHPGLRPGHGAAFAVEAEERDRLVIVQEVEPRARALDSDAAVQAIRKAISTRHELEVYAVVLVKAGEIPRTSSGKVRRSACRELYLNARLDVVAAWNLSPGAQPPGAPRAPAAAPRHATALEIETWLIERITTRLRVPSGHVSRSTPFVDLGMGSLDAVETVAELEAWLGRRLSPTAVYDYPTCAALALWLASPAPEALGAPEPAAPEPPPAAVDPKRLLADVGTMSEADLAAYIAQELAKERDA